MSSSPPEAEKPTNFLLIGRTGYGKSSTANSIMGRRRFDTGRSSSGLTQSCQWDVATVQGQTVMVMDSPGLPDIEINSQEGLEQLSSEAENILTSIPDGFDSILMVIPCERILTEEDGRVCKILDILFGEEYLKQYGILIVSCADIYDPEEHDNLPLEEYMKKGGGIMQEMLEKCSNRMVCFDNRTRDELIRNNQLTCLLDMVTEMKRTSRYTSKTFKNLQKSREVTILKMRKPLIREETEKLLKLIRQETDSVSANPVDAQKLKENVAKLQDHRKELSRKDKGTGVLTDIISMVSKEEGYVIAKAEDFPMMVEINKMETAGKNDQDVIRLIVVGKTGVGKSALCNSIIGQSRFEAHDDPASVTNTCQVEEAVVQGQNVVVVDTPGLAHTDMTIAENVQLLEREVGGALARNPDGFDAILIVLMHGPRLTMEDNHMFTQLDHMFGEDYTRQYGILIVTCADKYDPDMWGDMPVEECLRQHGGKMKEIREKCNDRVIAFDNKTKDKLVREDQVKRLLNAVTKMREGFRPYAAEAFRRVQELRHKKELNALHALENIMGELERISPKSKDIVETAVLTGRLQGRLEQVHQSLIERDNGAGMLSDTISSKVSAVQNAIKKQFNFLQQKKR